MDTCLMAKKALPLGEKFGRLLVLEEAEPYTYPDGLRKERMCLCQCDCGIIKAINANSIRRGLSTSCGCYRSERSTTHGCSRGKTNQAPDRAYGAWEAMKQRCLNPNAGKYPAYGGAGITICARWIHSFENFLADMGPAPSSEHSIDRKDGTRGYEPGNCRWATRQEQQRNLKTNRRLVVNGETLSFRDACDRVGISPELAQLRIKRGWTTERAVMTPPRTLKSTRWA